MNGCFFQAGLSSAAMSVVYAGIAGLLGVYIYTAFVTPMSCISTEACAKHMWWYVTEPVRTWIRVAYQVDMAFPALVISLVLSVIAYFVAYMSIKYSKDAFAQQGLNGIDLLKRDLWPKEVMPPIVPETQGLPCAAVYLLVLVIFIPFRYFGSSMYGLPKLLVGHAHSAPGLHQDLASFLSALLSIYSGTLLGFVDDVLDIRWRYKLPIPLLSSIPMLVVYMAGGGSTSIIVPAWPPVFRTVLGQNPLELGTGYYAYMMLLATFCTNCINILAGINGVEVGQALVIACSICINDLLYLNLPAVIRTAVMNKTYLPQHDSLLLGYHGSKDLVVRHLFSLHMLLPFIGTSLALFMWNRYPARVFVGDTYCYFAGMVLVSCGVLGHYSKTLLLFFLPQIFNFLLSCLQLFGVVPCPRHRVPFVDPDTRMLFPSCVRLHEETNAYVHCVLAILETCRFVQRIRDDNGRIVGVTNLTMLNALLVLRGSRIAPATVADIQASLAKQDPALRPAPIRTTLHVTEHLLWYHVMAVQIVGSMIAFTMRYWFAYIIFPST